jgi:hypothetical protein
MLYKAQSSTNPDPNIPSLVYLRLPDSWQESHPLASSLQHFEMALFLIALGRFPHALVSCVSVIESTIKAGLRIAPDIRALWKSALGGSPTSYTKKQNRV